MSRGTVDGLPSAHPLADLLPGVYLEDDLARGLTRGLDTVLAPVFLTLDCLDAYVAPGLAPEDFLPWLASWVGTSLVESWPVERKRRVVAAAVAQYRDRGTRAGLRSHLELLTDGEVEIHDSGGTLWSDDPDVDPPGNPTPSLRVVVRVDDPSALDQEWLRAAVRDARPAHLPFTVEVTGHGSYPPAVPGQRSRAADPAHGPLGPRGSGGSGGSGGD
jgi:phage tail-like protein